jgi:hypothetical protein
MRWLGKGFQELGSRRMLMKMRRFPSEKQSKKSLEERLGKVGRRG